ncbi:MAG TPA: RHS repeat-associated core domain-containing protein [Thermoanaerobaculia bacterium]
MLVVAFSGASDPARRNALWVAESAGALKIATADGSRLLEIRDVGDVRAVALDPLRATVWLWAGGTLEAYGFDGARRLGVPAALPETVHADLAVHPDDGSVWLAAGRELRSFSAAGQSLVSRPLLESVRSLSLDPTAGLLWVATTKAAVAHDAVTGAPVRLLDLGRSPDLRDLDADFSGGAGGVWIAQRESIRLHGADGALLLEIAGRNLAAVAADFRGGAWIASGKELQRIDAAGRAAFMLEPFAGQGEIAELVADPSDGSAWVANGQAVAQVSAAGQVVRSLKLSPPAHVRDLALYADTTPPELEILRPAAGAVLDRPDPEIEVRYNDDESGVDTASFVLRLDGEYSDAACDLREEGATCLLPFPLAEGEHTLAAAIRDFMGNAAGPVEVRFSVDLPDTGLPPDPAAVAPPLDRTVMTGMAASTAFLYTGSDSIQTGIEPGTVEPRRAAVVRGRVLTREGEPLPGARVRVLRHPEFGGTLSRADGMFDLAVNGGGALTLQYEKDGYAPAQRTVDVPWRDWVWAEDAALVPYDAQATTVASGAPELQVARGSEVVDEDGARRATLLFPAGMEASMVLPDGSVQPLPSLTVRATEYTVGPGGPKAMPAPLPPQAAYTYAVELSADEAVASGASRVIFSQPAIQYLENFLDFPVGGVVPAGYYDRELAAWVASDNGRIVKILGITGGLADLDVTGSGAPAGAEALAELGITDAERRRLALLYIPGQSLWRVPVPHFTPWDYNWPFGPPSDAVPPNQPEPEPEDPPEPEPDCQQGSIIDCQNQTLAESLSVAGTSFSLHYRSDRAPGRRSRSRLEIPLSGPSVPASLRRIELQVSAGGQLTVLSFPAQPNQKHTYIWDGRDAYGREVQGPVDVTVSLGYVYPREYRRPPDNFASSFGRLSGSGLAASGRDELIVYQTYSVRLGALGVWDAREAGLGGWTLDAHHLYDPYHQALHQGDGLTRDSRSPVAGRAIAPWTDAGGSFIHDLTTDARGNLYYSTNSRVFKVAPDGTTTTVAGQATGGFSGDGGPAVEAMLSVPRGLAIDPEGNLFIADSNNHRIRKVSADGIITTVAGGMGSGYRGDDGPANLAALREPEDVALDAEGNLYIADTGNNRVRKVSVDGVITLAAGNGNVFDDPPDGLATSVSLRRPTSVILDPEGRLLIADSLHNRVLRVEAGGKVRSLPRLPFERYQPEDLAIDRDGSVLLADQLGFVRKITPGGVVATIAGTLIPTASGLAGPAGGVRLGAPQGISVDPEGNFFILVTADRKILKASPLFPGFADGETFIPSEDGGEVFVFDAEGRHLRTLEALTGEVLFRLSYNTQGLLVRIEDGDGNATRIERDASGRAQAIVAPFGQRTALTLDAEGFLERVRNPQGEEIRLIYHPGGLLATLTDARQNTYRFTYDELGRLARDQDPANGFKSLARTQAGAGYRVDLSTALGRAFRYDVEPRAAGGKRRTVTGPAGLRTTTDYETSGKRTVRGPDGAVLTLVEGSDPRFSLQASLPASAQIRTPSGLTATTTFTRNAILDAGSFWQVRSLQETLSLNGDVFIRQFDAAQRKFTFTTPEGRRSTATIDGQGRPLSVQVDGLDPVEFAYDGRGRLASLLQGTGEDRRSLALGYNANGWLATVTDPLTRSVSFERDDAGRVLRQALPDGRAIGFSYDENGNVTSITPPGRPSHAFAYTPVDLQDGYEPPGLGGGAVSTTYDYNLDRQLTQVHRPGGELVELTYDSAGRLRAVSFSEGDLAYTYSSTTGRLATLAAPDGETLAYSYDGFLPTGTTWSGPIAGSVENTYDNRFRVTARKVNGADPVAFQYDRDSLLTRAGSLTLHRDPRNGLLTGATLGQVTTAQSYNGFGEMSAFEARIGADPVLTIHYTRDKLGRIIEKIETLAGTTDVYAYTYDLSGRLSEVHRNGARLSHYGYGANSNRTAHVTPSETIIATYDAQDRLLTYGDTTYAYTANGELASKTQNGQAVTYDYDELGNLREVTLPDGIHIEYVIDGQNRRVGKKINGAFVQGFLYQNQLNPIAELDATGNVIARFIYGSRPNVPDYMIKGGTTYSIVSDHLGSPRLVIDTGTGAVIQRMDYDEFGNVILNTNPGFQPFGFAGGLYDRQTGLVRFGARDYEAEAGRWTAKDPIAFTGGDANLYGYVSVDPINFIDPRGWMKLPVDPSGLSPEWKHDPSHRHPGGQRFRGPNGDILDWHAGKPEGERNQGKDHWHHYPGGEGQRHRPLLPGDEIPDPPSSSCKVNDDVDFNLPAFDPSYVPVAIGIGIIVGTIIEDLLTGGLGVGDDPATIGLGLSMVFGGGR